MLSVKYIKIGKKEKKPNNVKKLRKKSKKRLIISN